MPAFASAKQQRPPSTLGGPAALKQSHAGKPGQTIVVADGDTLMSIGRRYNVPMSVLMEQNGLRSIALKPGTELFVPKLQPSYRK